MKQLVGVSVCFEDLEDEREDLIEALEQLPKFSPGPDWHRTEQHILMQCLIDVDKEIQEKSARLGAVPGESG